MWPRYPPASLLAQTAVRSGHLSQLLSGKFPFLSLEKTRGRPPLFYLLVQALSHLKVGGNCLSCFHSRRSYPIFRSLPLSRSIMASAPMNRPPATVMMMPIIRPTCHQGTRCSALTLTGAWPRSPGPGGWCGYPPVRVALGCFQVLQCRAGDDQVTAYPAP